MKIESWARQALNDYPGNRQADYQFHGYNDNMPSKASMGMILGGEYFGDAAAVEHGLWSLRQLRDMLSRRGLISEYNSPNYAPLTIANLAEVAKYARHPEARSLAAKCAERVWADLLGHFHPPTGLVSGPYARGYTADSAGHLSSVNFIMWLTFGEGVWPTPLPELCIEPPRLVMHDEGNLFYMLASYCWLAAFEYEPPAHLVRWLESRTYPYRLIATAERGEGGNGAWAASEIICTTSQEEDFALGTSEGDWDGQADEFFLQYRCRTPARGAQDVRTAYHRFLINDDLPGKTGTNARGLPTGEKQNIPDMGRYHTVQQDGVALVSVSAHPKLIDKPLTRMGCAFILPEHLSPVPKIEWSDGHVWIEDGPFYLAVRPLEATDLGRGEAVQIQKVNRYRMILLPNYQGPQRKFSRAELATIVNGFIVVCSAARHESFADFRRRILDGRLLDYVLAGSRTLRYKLDKLELALSYGIESNGVRFATINGKIVLRPLWQATGLPAEQLPFLDGPPVPNTMELPFQHMRLIWAPEAHWQIFSRG